MREHLRKLIAEKEAKVAEQRDAIRKVLEAPEAEARGLNPEEAEAFRTAKAEIESANKEAEDLREQVKELDELDELDEKRESQAQEIQPKPNTQTKVAVRNEPITYGPNSDASFFADAYALRAGQGDVEGAVERLTRHNAEVRAGAHGGGDRVKRAAASVSTGGFSSLVVPQYLPEMFAENLIAGRVTANLAEAHDLPSEGMTITIPRGTTATGVTQQTSENGEVHSETFGTDDLVVNVRTYAGQQDVSRQSIERGRGVDAILYADLAANYANKLNRDVLAGPGSNGRHRGVLNTSAVTSITVSETSGSGQLRRVAQAIGVVNTNRLSPATVVVVHPRRWAAWTAAVDANNRPLVVPDANAPTNTFGVGTAAAVQQRVGQVHGLPVFTDPSISTVEGVSSDEDYILVMKANDLKLWEESTAPRQFRFEETLGGNLTIKLVVAGYSAFTAGYRPEGIVRLNGAGLNEPYQHIS